MEGEVEVLIVGDSDSDTEGLTLSVTGGEVEKRYGDVLGGLTEDGVASDGWVLGREAEPVAFGKTGSLAILSISASILLIASLNMPVVS
jgi:hypothetical protein